MTAELLSEQRNPNCWTQYLRVPLDLACWPGHFPTQSILPGVVQLTWVVTAIQKWLESAPPIARIEALKFKAPILPGETLTLVLRRDDSRFRFEFKRGEEVCSQGRLTLAQSKGAAE